MKEYSLTLQLKSIAPVLLRQRQALILLRDQERNFILGQKQHYPEGISRLIGGGLEPNEDPLAGAVRELAEETGVAAKPNQLKPLAHIQVTIFLIDEAGDRTTKEPIQFETYLYFFEASVDQIQASSDLDELKFLTEHEFEKLIARFSNLSPVIVPPQTFSWHDYGQYFAMVHEIALAEYRGLTT